MADTSELPQLTPEYIKDHMIGVHSYESFGRSIAGGVLTQALERAQNNGLVNNEVKIHLEFTVKPTFVRCIEIYTLHGWIHVLPGPLPK